MNTYNTLEDHRGMFFDEARNAAYRRAMEQVIRPDSVVLDLGAGLGILGLIALECGAAKVYMVEPADIIETTRIAVGASKYNEQVVCLKGRIEDVELPERVDLILSVFTGNFLLTEDLLPSLFYARDNYLKTDGVMLPDRAAMVMAPVMATKFYASRIDCWETDDFGGALQPIRGYASNTQYPGYAKQHRANLLAAPATFHELDFYCATNASCDSKVAFKATADGVCHGLLGWFQTRLADEWLSTAPESTKMHWRQVFMPLHEPFEVSPDQELSARIQRRDFGEWTWTVQRASAESRQSTFLSRPLSVQALKPQSESYQPTLGQKGQRILEVMNSMDGSKNLGALAEQLITQSPEFFKTRKAALSYLIQLVNLIEE